MAQQGQYPLNGRTPIGTDTATGVVTGATADIPLSDIAALVPLATDSSPGIVEPDGTTITIVGGVITASSGAGTVTSVGVAAPSDFTIAGSPVTTSGTITLSYATQTAAQVFAGPATGSAATPAFRALVGTDLPLATTSLFGAVKPDGTTITVTGGVISSVAGGSGTVTSVGLTAPSQFAVTGTPVTSTGTLALAWNTQATNLVLAAPNGSTGVPTFRSLVPADLPTATGAAKGIVQPDGTTITISGGVISAVSAGTGTVTSVGLALPSTIIAVSGTPVTSSGTLTGTLQTQTANTVWAGAVSGGVATPAFRALVAADMPSSVATSGANSNITSLTGLTTPLTVAQGGMGAGTHTAHGVLIGEGTSAVAATTAGTVGQVLTSGGASADPAWGNPGQPYFQVYLNANQTGVASGTVTKINFDTVVFDPNSYWDATNHRWLPLKAGKYAVHCNAYITGTGAANATVGAIIQKTSAIMAQQLTVAPTGTVSVAVAATLIATMNGTTDYIEGFGYFGVGTSISFNAGQSLTYLEAFYIGP